MNSKAATLTFSRRKVWLKCVGALVVLVLAALLTASVACGYGLNLRSFGRAGISLIQAISASSKVASLNQGKFQNIIFLHHSVGTNLLDETDLRQKFGGSGYYLWDHGYNWQGLRDPSGEPTGYSYNILNDDSDPRTLAQIFAQPLYTLPLNTLSSLMQYEVIVFKSCFPASSIGSDQRLQDYQTWYLGMRDFMDQHPEKIFIALTPPPLHPAETTTAEAQRARAFANWLKSGEFIEGHPNVFVFDLFGLLAEDDPQSPDLNRLKAEYRGSSVDSHPNLVANKAIAPELFDFVTTAIQQYTPSR